MKKITFAVVSLVFVTLTLGSVLHLEAADFKKEYKILPSDFRNTDGDE